MLQVSASQPLNSTPGAAAGTNAVLPTTTVDVLCQDVASGSGSRDRPLLSRSLLSPFGIYAGFVDIHKVDRDLVADIHVATTKARVFRAETAEATVRASSGKLFRFFSEVSWREYARAGKSVLPLPLLVDLLDTYVKGMFGWHVDSPSLLRLARKVSLQK